MDSLGGPPSRLRYPSANPSPNRSPNPRYETAGRVAEARRATDSARQKTDALTFVHPAY